MERLISSLQNPKIKISLGLKNRKNRDLSGTFLIEGYREVKRALDADRTIDLLFFCPEFFLGENEEKILKRCPECYRCTKKVFAKISYRDRPDGLIAIAKQEHRSLKDLVLRENPFLAIAESIEKPGNLGTILRSSDAAGTDGLIVCDPKTDIHNPNVVRASVGTLFTQQVIEAGAEETIRFLQEKKIPIIAATPHARKEYTELEFKGPVAIAFGTEQYGLSEKWFTDACLSVKIPMLGDADSLNVASATTILLYEVVRQRRHLRR